MFCGICESAQIRYFNVISPLKKAVRLIEASTQSAIDSIVGDGVELLHAIEQTEHEKEAIQSPRKLSRKAKKRH